MSRTRIWLTTIASALALACGGGGGSSGGGGGTAASEGPIQGFGSVIMNGVRWDTDHAAFEIDGDPGEQDDLDLGMVVRVEGERKRGGARADRVIFDTRLRGPIREIQDLGPDVRVLTIFDIPVTVSRSETIFRDTTIDDLQTGLLVDASGLIDASGEMSATYLRDRGTADLGDEVKLYGQVADLAGTSFLLRDTVVLYMESDLDDDGDSDSDFGANGLENGDLVRVEGFLLSSDRVDAEEIEPFRRHRDEDRDFGEVEVQGVVSNFVSLAEFEVAGRQVDASAARFIPDEPGLVMNGVRVGVRGDVDDQDVLVADRVRLRSQRVKIEAAIRADDDVDASAGTLVLLGILIEVPAEAEFDDGLGLEDLRAGDFIELEGLKLPDGRILASEIEIEDDEDVVKIEGPIDLVDPANERFTILGVEIPTDAETEFEIDDGENLTSDEFYALVQIGDVVEAEEREDGELTTFGVADEVEIEERELEDHDDDSDEDSDFDDDEDSDSDARQDGASF